MKTLILFLLFSGLAYADIVTETIAKEASGEPFEAQILVARVIRVRSEQRRLTPSQVCLQPKQFSCWNKGVKQKPRTKAELDRAAQAWKLSERGDIVNLYHDISVNPYWVSKVTFVKQIGRLKFYKE